MYRYWCNYHTNKGVEMISRLARNFKSSCSSWTLTDRRARRFRRGAQVSKENSGWALPFSHVSIGTVCIIPLGLGIASLGYKKWVRPRELLLTTHYVIFYIILDIIIIIAIIQATSRQCPGSIGSLSSVTIAENWKASYTVYLHFKCWISKIVNNIFVMFFLIFFT